MASANTASTWDEWLRKQLPPGVGYSWANDNLVLELEDEFGLLMVTLYWRARYLEMGASGGSGPGRRAWMPPGMVGRGWRERLLQAAVDRLREAKAELEEGLDA
ncbi:hypothetical protein SAMN05660831_00045 [Thiohalospira halophila DSM 15071]|uniref:Uncharacterized protein n=1 Tax=Thiohalospira halophila DSM 15071 TaxID=1123397 RepID=A0A1I1N7V4_9GAMM|nr:hypothetical protein [Thiohalospira halophila]SFC90863.1 hypothetical protein SAMN05660831_00045 [Thiohalospira halophila DSM 15071]